MNMLITLLKREYWENRGGFAITPLVIGAAMVVFLILALFNTEHLLFTHGEEIAGISINGISISGFDFLGELTREFSNLPLAQRTKMWEMGFYGISGSFSLVLVMVSFIYLLGCLYDDRKDKSILFWKSLPVSDLMTVLSKVITVIFIIPALYIAVLTVTFILIMLIASFAAIFNGGSVWESIWYPAPFLKAPLTLYVAYVFQSLWAAPFLGWLLLVSSWTKRKPILLATIPLGVITFIEFYYYRTTYFRDSVQERVIGWVFPVDTSNGMHLGNNALVENQSDLYNNAYSLVGVTEFWYGLAVTAVMVAGAVYIRRYRDEL